MVRHTTGILATGFSAAPVRSAFTRGVITAVGMPARQG